MCGYCIESIGLEQSLFFKNEPESVVNIFFLQEYADLLKAIEIILKNCEAEEKLKNNEEKLNYLNSHIILCRVIENLVNYGFQSNYLKSILKNDLVQESILCECIEDSCKIQTLGNLSFPYHKTHYPLNRKINNDQFQHATKIFPNISFFKPLYQASNYFSEKQWHAFLTKDVLIENCFEIINSYSNWWLEGGSLEYKNAEAITDELNGTGVAYDPLMNVSKEDRLLFDFVFRALYFSVNHIGKLPHNMESLENIIFLLPSDVPFFDGLDLWLNRKASEICYRQKGIPFFETSISNIRSILMSYLVAKFDIAGDERKKIADLIQFSKYFDNNDIYTMYIREPDSLKDIPQVYDFENL